MTVVIADSSPLNYLTLIGSVDVLHRLYGAVVVPQQVMSELIDPAAPHDVRQWASNPPDWIDVRDVVISDDDMTHLDLGERAAAVLAQVPRISLTNSVGESRRAESCFWHVESHSRHCGRCETDHVMLTPQ